MTKHEAKMILHARRASGGDESDPTIAAALEFARNDPELCAWLDDWQALDRSIASKLKTVPLPEGLLEQVRSGAAARAFHRRSPFLHPLALAACLALIGVLVAVWMGRPTANGSDVPLMSLRSDMAAFLNEFPQMDLETDRLPEVREWLAERHPLTTVDFPLNLQAFPTLGCRTVSWRGIDLALVCFMADGEVVHLLMVPTDSLPDDPGTLDPVYASAGRFRTTAWTSGGTLYLALTPGGEDVLHRLL